MSFIKIADKVREAFKELEAKSPNGRVTPQALVKYAEPKDSPLHNQFEWNDRKAGQEYRLWQGRQLLRRITVNIEDKSVREYQNITIEIEEGKEQGYYSLYTVMSNKDLKVKMMRQILKELGRMEQKYSTYKELSKMLNKKKIEEYREQYLA